MSLIGIDIGTSAIKVAAYSEGGVPLAGARRAVPAHRPRPGHWEVDVRDSTAAFWAALASVAEAPPVKADQPVAISFSSSGREVFPVSDDGNPLGPCLMTPDVRGDDVARDTAALHSPEEWFRMAGHVPRRMDPVNRARWWLKTDPAVSARTRWMMNWHEYYSLLLSGRPVADWSNAGAWATYDMARAGWSEARISELGIDPDWLPEIQPNGAPIGRILPQVAERMGLPWSTLIVTGAFDVIAAAVGSGAIDEGVVALNCGTWHSFSLPIAAGWPAGLVHDGVTVLPHPGPTGFAILVTNPNGMSVIDWARNLLHLSIEDVDTGLAAAEDGPGHLFADPSFTPLPHQDAGTRFGGALTGVTLATTGLDIIQALLEGIALEFSLALEALRAHGVEPRLIRASGGGARSIWWLQLTADVTGLPVEVVQQEEPGTLGAAILAGIGAEVFDSLSSATARLVAVDRHYSPNHERGALYGSVRERLAAS